MNFYIISWNVGQRHHEILTASMSTVVTLWHDKQPFHENWQMHLSNGARMTPPKFKTLYADDHACEGCIHSKREGE